MTLVRRKFNHHITGIPSSVLYLLLGNVTPSGHRICSRNFQAHSSPQLTSSSLSKAIEKGMVFEMKFSSTIAGTILVQARDPAKLAMEIQDSLDDRRLDDAWKFYEQHMSMDGFPRKSVVSQILRDFAESLDVQWLEKAFEVVQKACDEGKHNLLEKDTLVYLSLALAKSGLQVPASTVLRKLVEMQHYPHVYALAAILAYMSQTASGAYLAGELILEIGYLFQDNRVDPRKKSNTELLSMKPNTTAFSIALAGCLLFDTTRRAEQLLDMMPRVGVKVDSNLLIVMAHVFERNGRRDEIMKLERHIDEAYNLNEIQFRQFQSCLLTCHLKLGDLDSASNMVIDMLRKAKSARSSLAAASVVINSIVNKCKPSPGLGSRGLEDRGSASTTPMVSYEEYLKDRKLEIVAKEMLATMLAKVQTQVELLTTERGIIQPTEKLIVKLVKAYLEAGKTKDLVEFVVKTEREDSPVSNDDSILVQVVNACVSLGWLEAAHDVLDEMQMVGIRTTSSVYSSLLRAYCRANRTGDAAALLRDSRKAGIQLDSSSYNALIESNLLQQDTKEAVHLFKEMKEAKIPRTGHRQFENLLKGCSEGGEGKMMSKLLEEIREGQRGADCGVHDWNNVIHYFSKKRLMKDAEKALRKMVSLGYAPNAQTFHSMVTGYAAVGGNYMEVTELWGEMKTLACSVPMRFDQELLDCVLYTFVRGGFFGRANEVVEMMERGKMFVDKYKYRTLFLKYHRTFYKGKAPKFQTELQLRKRQSALTFKRWIGLD